MFIWTHLAEALSQLGLIIAACIPVFVVLLLLEKVLDYATDRMYTLDIAGWLDRKLEQAKAREAELRGRRENNDSNTNGDT